MNTATEVLFILLSALSGGALAHRASTRRRGQADEATTVIGGLWGTLLGVLLLVPLRNALQRSAPMPASPPPAAPTTPAAPARSVPATPRPRDYGRLAVHAGLLFALIVLAYGVYAQAFIYKTSAMLTRDPNRPWITEDKRYFVLFDDAMISMRYARNLADGEGLVWNPGEKVEGFTNPAWVVYMALFHLPDLDSAHTSLAIQLSGAVFLALNLLVVRRIAEHLTPNPAVMLGAVLFTAFYLPLNTWSLQGTEVSILTLAVSLAALWALRALQAGRFSRAPYLLLGASTLVRMDMAVPYGMLALFFLATDRAHRRRHLVAAPLILLAFLGAQTLFRVWYYDEWLPNTYYLKMQGIPVIDRVRHGLDVTLRVFIKLGVLPLLVFAFRRDRAVWLLAWLFAGQVAYSVYVGGDAWEWYGGANRYVAIAMPLFLLLLWLFLGELHDWLVAASTHLAQFGAGWRVNPAAVRIALGVFALFTFVSMNATYGPDALNEWLLREPSLDAEFNGDKVEQSLAVTYFTNPGARIALAGAGIVPYYAPARVFVDMLGKMDKHIARLSMDRALIPELKPGHMKWDYAYSIGELQPDVVMELWIPDRTLAQACPYLDCDAPMDAKRYIPVWFPPSNADFYLRRDAPGVRWQAIWPDYEPPTAEDAGRDLDG